MSARARYLFTLYIQSNPFQSMGECVNDKDNFCSHKKNYIRLPWNIHAITHVEIVWYQWRFVRGIPHICSHFVDRFEHIQKMRNDKRNLISWHISYSLPFSPLDAFVYIYTCEHLLGQTHLGVGLLARIFDLPICAYGVKYFVWKIWIFFKHFLKMVCALMPLL